MLPADPWSMACHSAVVQVLTPLLHAAGAAGHRRQSLAIVHAYSKSAVQRQTHATMHWRLHASGVHTNACTPAARAPCGGPRAAAPLSSDCRSRQGASWPARLRRVPCAQRLRVSSDVSADLSLQGAQLPPAGGCKGQGQQRRRGAAIQGQQQLRCRESYNRSQGRHGSPPKSHTTPCYTVHCAVQAYLRACSSASFMSALYLFSALRLLFCASSSSARLAFSSASASASALHSRQRRQRSSAWLSWLAQVDSSQHKSCPPGSSFCVHDMLACEAVEGRSVHPVEASHPCSQAANCPGYYNLLKSWT